MALVIILVVLVVMVFWLIGIYNSLVRLRNTRQNAFADIDVQLRQRHDLIPQLVETVKGYATHERELLIRVTEARTAAMGATTIDEKIKTETQLSSALQGLKVSVEAYPDLKANENFVHLHASWNEAEEQISASRRYYNAAVTDYNNSIQTFPSSIIAKQMGFTHKNVFEISEEERQNINAKELFAK